MRLIAGIALLVSMTAFADDPAEPYQADGGQFYMNAIEYWGECGYAGGSGVSFGFRTNAVESNQACALQAFAELKAVLDSETPEMRELAQLDGPTGIYLIMSDCTRTSPIAARMWHYAASDDGTGGLIKFHAVTRLAADGSVVCRTPSRADFAAFVAQTSARIRASRPQPVPAPTGR